MFDRLSKQSLLCTQGARTSTGRKPPAPRDPEAGYEKRRLLPPDPEALDPHWPNKRSVCSFQTVVSGLVIGISCACMVLFAFAWPSSQTPK